MSTSALGISEGFVYEDFLANEQIKSTPNLQAIKPRILLLDDDAIFNYAFRKLARRLHVPVQAFESFYDFNKAPEWNFDLVLMDYDLGAVSGIDFAKYLEDKVGDVPVLLVSYSDRYPTLVEPWPGVIKAFCNKQMGMRGIYEQAMHVFLALNRRQQY